MRRDVEMYFYLRKYLSPVESYELVKNRYDKIIRHSISDLESMRLKSRFRVRELRI